MTQYVFMTETKHLRISQKHSMRAIFMQIWQLEVIFWFMTEKYVHYLKVMKTYFHAVVISTSSDRNRPILRRAGASDERLWVLVCALGSTQGLQVHAEPSKFRVIKHMAWPVAISAGFGDPEFPVEILCSLAYHRKFLRKKFQKIFPKLSGGIFEPFHRALCM